MRRFLDPTNDIAFKKVFATEAHKPLLLSFLNAILRLQDHERIVTLDYLPQEAAPLIEGGKRAIFDVKCRDKQKREFIVEMQNRKLPEFVKHSQYYVSHAYVSQLGQGTPYFSLKPIVLVAISSFGLFTDSQDPISFHQTLNIETHQNHLQDLSYVFVELSKFKKGIEELEGLEDQWLFYLKHAQELSEIPKSVVNAELRAAYESLEQFNWGPGEYDAYVKANILLTDEYTRQQKSYEEGEQKGIKKGIEQGIEKGIEQGVQAEKRTIAQRMLKQGCDLSLIEQVTGLPRQAIEQLQKG